ncbi:MAG: hypothetical protein AAGU11_13515 [Syntrophobacteraceae bacterium]
MFQSCDTEQETPSATEGPAATRDARATNEPESRVPPRQPTLENDGPARKPGEQGGTLKAKRRNPFTSLVKSCFARVRNGRNQNDSPGGNAHEESIQLECACEPAYTRTRVVPVPREDFKSNRIVALDESDPITDQFKLLRTHVFQQTRPRGWRTIQVAGFDSGGGSSLVATNLAISISRDVRQTALLVDLNFRNPSVERLLNLKCDVGLKSYFLDDIGLEQILVNPAIGKLTVLPAGGRITHAPELMGSPKMQQLVRELKERYSDRYIIFDTPPVSSYPDSLVFSEYVDAIILVARADRTTQDNVKAAVELIPREKILGVVLNDSQEAE